MAVSSEVTITQDGGAAKLHPYLVALVRWCVSCVWSTATVLLHRMMIKPLPQITGAATKLSKPRPAGREHLHPEPKVECVVLHQPDVHNLDVIFVHGLYGSLCNTWRQGEWRSRYQSSPEKVHLRRPTASPSRCTCLQCYKTTEKQLNNKNNFNNDHNCFEGESMIYYSQKDNKYVYEENKYDNRLNTNIINNYENTFNGGIELIKAYDSNDAFRNIDETFYKDITKILPREDVFITEKFYNNTLLDQVEIIENYETQAKFVSDLFKNCDYNCDNENKRADNDFDNKTNGNMNEQNVNNKHYHEDCTCSDEKCEVGCGCICDDCYSPCWPKDWIKVDYPEARVISINYTSDPHLWRPLWIKENKRLCLHERAEQMTEQLLELGVGQRPVIWVGHSKGGLFIKQIYCEAYEAYQKTHSEQAKQENITLEQTAKEISKIYDGISVEEKRNNNNSNIKHSNITMNSEKIRNNNCDINFNNNMDENTNPSTSSLKVDDNSLKTRNDDRHKSTNITEDFLSRRAALWSNSGAFMFYSVPHRGSPLADIKTPITARSIELIEISKDNSLVLSLQERWLRATAFTKPLVRSLVETRRTLMSVLWLRIVDTDSADPGIGALCGVPVDHREICKPSSRRCLLYTELSALIKAAMNRFKPISS